MNHPVLQNFKEVHDTDFATFFLNELGDTLITRYKESIVIDLEIAKASFIESKPFKDAGSKYGIVDFSAQFLDVTVEARKHFRENVSPSNTNLMSIIVGNLVTKTMASIYARFDKPIVLSRVFTDIRDAHDWILENKV